MSDADLKRITRELLEAFPNEFEADLDAFDRVDGQELIYTFKKSLNDVTQNLCSVWLRAMHVVDGEYQNAWQVYKSERTSTKLLVGDWLSLVNAFFDFKDPLTAQLFVTLIENSKKAELIKMCDEKTVDSFRLSADLEIGAGNLHLDRVMTNSFFVEVVKSAKKESEKWLSHRLEITITDIRTSPELFEKGGPTNAAFRRANQGEDITRYRLTLNWCTEADKELEKVEPLTPKELK